MQKTLLLLFLGLLTGTFTPARGQDQAAQTRRLLDSTWAVARQHPHDSTGAHALARLSELRRRGNPDSGIYYAKRAIVAARPYPRLAVLSHNMLAIAYYYKGNYPAALAAFDSAYAVAKRYGNVRQMGEMVNNAANVAIELGDYAGALTKYRTALALQQQAGNDYDAAMAVGNIGYVYKEIGDYDQALQYFFRALRMSEAHLRRPGLDDTGRSLTTTAIASVQEYVGETYKRMNNWPQARRYFEQALARHRATRFNEGIITSLRNLAAGNAANGQPTLALAQLREALALHEKVHDQAAIAATHAEIAGVLTQLGQYPAAVAEYEQAVALNRSIRNVPQQSSALLGLAGARLHARQLPAARQALDSAAAYVRKANSRQSWRDYHETQSRYFAQAGDPGRALASYRLYTTYKDSLLNAEGVKAMADVAVKYETDKKEQQLKLSEQQIRLQEAQISRRNLIIGAVLAGALALVLLGYSYYRRYQLQQQTRMQQEILHQQNLATKAVLDAEEKERRRIALDLHDGVGQVMSAAKMNLAAIEDEIPFGSTDQRLAFRNAMQLVDDGCREVRAVSHSMMPNALLKAGLGAAIREFLDQIDHRVLKINLLTEGLNEKLDSNTETVLYRVVQECVNNVIKHAQASQLDLSLRQEEDGISAMIEDNGRGFDTTDRSKFDGIGLKNIQSRLALLGGSVEWSSQPGRGTAVAVFVPNTPPE
jgi:two-component system NarL family sensor kinase